MPVRRRCLAACAGAVLLGVPLAAPAVARASAPTPVSAARAGSVTTTSAVLSWTNPRSSTFRTVVVRRAVGTIAPATVSRGTAVATVARTRHAVALTRLAAGTVYTFALFASDGQGHYARATAVRVQTVPAGVTGLTGTTGPSWVRLAWRASTSGTVTAVVARYRAGSVAPASPAAGAAVPVPSPRATTASVPGLAPGTSYAFAVWTRDGLNHWSTAANTVVRTTTPPVVPPVVTPPAGGSLAGRVTGPDGSGVGRVGVVVFATTAGHLAAADRTTDSAGAFRIDDLPVGTYRICFDGSAVDASYQRVCSPGVPWNGDLTVAPAAAQAVPVTANTTTALPTAVLSPPDALTGQVTAAADGSALGGVRVWLFDTSGQPVDTTRTGDDGAYRLSSVVPGRYVVCFSAGDVLGGPSAHGYLGQCGGAPWTGGAVPATAAVLTAGGGGSDVVDASLTGVVDTGDVGSIAGTVTAAATRQGVAGVTVTAYDNGGGAQGSAVTDGTGVYTIAGLATSATGYRVCFDASAAAGAYLDQCYLAAGYDPQLADGSARPVPVSGAVSAVGVDAALVASGSVAGTVTGRSGPVAGVTVDVLDLDGTVVGTATTASTGTYRVTGLAPSSVGYYVCFDGTGVFSGYAAGYAGQCWLGAAWDGVTVPTLGLRVPIVAGAAVVGTNALLTAAGLVSGTVRDSATTTVAGVDVHLYSLGGTALADSVTSDDGSYGFLGLASGSYFVCADAVAASGSASTTGYADQCLGGQPWDGRTAPTLLTATPVVVVGGVASTGNDLRLTPGGAIGGTVAGPGGPAAGVLVQVWSATGAMVSGASAYTDASGGYTVVGLAAGSYDVCFDASIAGDGTGAALAGQCWSGVAWDPSTAAVPAGATPVAVRAAATTTVSPRLVAG